ncbi:MAG: hypothetical protein ABSG64_08655 [Solirubrobacteraceae bacterium]|jgi:hypothetical protein
MTQDQQFGGTVRDGAGAQGALYTAPAIVTLGTLAELTLNGSYFKPGTRSDINGHTTPCSHM